MHPILVLLALIATSIISCVTVMKDGNIPYLSSGKVSFLIIVVIPAITFALMLVLNNLIQRITISS